MPSIAVEGQKPLTKKDVKKLTEMLLQKRDELTGQITSLRNDAIDDSDSINWEEDGTDAFDREFAFQMAGSRNDMLNQIEDSLRRIHEDTFGNCDMCGGKIGAARMKALPFCKTCIECQSQSEVGRPPRIKIPA